MPKFGARSLKNLATVDERLVKVLNAAVASAGEGEDFTVICGHRGRAEQEASVRAGTSNAHFGQSAHNVSPSRAIDFIPYPFDNTMWNSKAKFRRVWEHIERCAKAQGVGLTWGGEWSLGDYGHIELSDWRRL